MLLSSKHVDFDMNAYIIRILKTRIKISQIKTKNT